MLQVLQEWGQSFFTWSDEHCPVHANIMQSIFVSMQLSEKVMEISFSLCRWLVFSFFFSFFLFFFFLSKGHVLVPSNKLVK